MEWINVFGLIFVAVMMIPNIFDFTGNSAREAGRKSVICKSGLSEGNAHGVPLCRDGFRSAWQNRAVECVEQLGRLGCIFFMIMNIPGTWFGWWSDEAFAVYLIVDAVLVLLYSAIWAICFRRPSLFRTLALSILPSVLFFFSGIMSRSIPLIASSLLFAPSHILISYKTQKASV